MTGRFRSSRRALVAAALCAVTAFLCFAYAARSVSVVQWGLFGCGWLALAAVIVRAARRGVGNGTTLGGPGSRSSRKRLWRDEQLPSGPGDERAACY